MATAEKLDPRIEEAARSFGRGPWHVVRDVIMPGLKPALISAGAICFATAMGAFGTAFTLATRINVLPMVIYTEFTLRPTSRWRPRSRSCWARNLGRTRTSPHRRRAHRCRGGLMTMRRSPALLSAARFHAGVCAFLVVPVRCRCSPGSRSTTRRHRQWADAALGLKVWDGYRNTSCVDRDFARLPRRHPVARRARRIRARATDQPLTRASRSCW